MLKFRMKTSVHVAEQPSNDGRLHCFSQLAAEVVASTLFAATAEPAAWATALAVLGRAQARFPSRPQAEPRARSRLHRSEILQENMRLTAFFKLYKICIFLHRCNLKIFAKNRFEKTAIFVKFQQKIANVAKIAKSFQISKISTR